jgi:hypothetical protein
LVFHGEQWVKALLAPVSTTLFHKTVIKGDEPRNIATV